MGTAVRSVPLVKGAAGVRRRRRRSPSREEFLTRIFELYVEFGYEGTTINVITQAVGVTKRTVYAKYGDKDALLVAALQHTIAQWIVQPETLRNLEVEDFGDTLVAVAFRLLENLLSPRGLQLLHMTNALSLKAPELGAHNVRHGIEPTLGYLSDLLSRRLGRQAGPFATFDMAAMAFLNLTVGGLASLVSWGVLLDDEVIDPYIRSTVKLFVNGLAEQRTAAAEALAQENTQLKLLVADLVIAGHKR